MQQPLNYPNPPLVQHGAGQGHSTHTSLSSQIGQARTDFLKCFPSYPREAGRAKCRECSDVPSGGHKAALQATEVSELHSNQTSIRGPQNTHFIHGYQSHGLTGTFFAQASCHHPHHSV